MIGKEDWKLTPFPVAGAVAFAAPVESTACVPSQF